jgi:hypothetical protein
MLLTRHIQHHEDSRKISTSILHNVVMKTKDIIGILKSCQDLLVPEQSVSVTGDSLITSGNELADTPLSDLSLDVYEFLTQPQQPRRPEMSDVNYMKGFSEEFCHQAKFNPIKQGYVGRNTLGKLRKKYGIKETAAGLISQGLITGHVSDELDRVGWYTAGPKMITDDSSKTSEHGPEDPYEYAQWVVAQEPALLADYARIQERLKEVAVARKAIEELMRLKESRPVPPSVSQT